MNRVAQKNDSNQDHSSSLIDGDQYQEHKSLNPKGVLLLRLSKNLQNKRFLSL